MSLYQPYLAETWVCSLKAVCVYNRPVDWKGKQYLRAKAAGNEHAREKAEDKEREQLARGVSKVLVDARLPFGAEALDKGWDHLSPETGRCFRGLRSATLRKRASDIAFLARLARGDWPPLYSGKKRGLPVHFDPAREGVSEDGPLSQ